MSEPKAHLITIRMSDEENDRASAVAEHYGINVASMIRMLLKREATDLTIDAKPAAARRKTATK